MRDPRDVAVSYANHYGRSVLDSVTLIQNEENFFHEPGNSFPKAIIGSSQTNVRSWMEAPFPVLVLRFEDLIADPDQYTGDILAFLKIKPKVSVNKIVRNKTIYR